MQMVRSNENNIIYSNSMKTDYWDEIYPDDKTYIRPEDGKKFSIVNGVFYAVHPNLHIICGIRRWANN